MIIKICVHRLELLSRHFFNKYIKLEKGKYEILQDYISGIFWFRYQKRKSSNEFNVREEILV